VLASCIVTSVSVEHLRYSSIVRTIVVTGSASGLGAATRARLEQAGDTVIGVDLRDADIEADLSTSAGRADALDAVAAKADRLDGAVVCAGLGPHVTPTSLLVAVNYFGAVDVLDGLLPLLSEGTDPAAVAVASNSIGLIPDEGTVVETMLAGDEAAARAIGDGIPGAVLYGLTKQALARAVRRRAVPWGEAGVRLNAIAPGPTMTPLLQGSLDDDTLGPLVDALPIPLRRRAEPDEMAGVMTFLLSPEASYVHGAIWFADGGTDAEVRPDHF
jgi:NAD(P)-dependent dehydrogenase (short-subunit alcohol dehydrogenase family)